MKIEIKTNLIILVAALATVFGMGLGVVTASGPNPSLMVARLMVSVVSLYVAILVLEMVLRLVTEALGAVLKFVGDFVIWMMNAVAPLKSKTDDPRREYWDKRLRRLLRREEREAEVEL